MQARNKKSLNTGYKNRKNKEKAGPGNDLIATTTAGVVEKEVVVAVRSEIKRGKEDQMKNNYGETGLEEYLVGGQFEKLGEENFYELGKKYYKKSCEKGHPLGQFAVALMYLKGSLGQAKDEKLGVEMMSKSAKAGCGPALFYKGRWLMDGSHEQTKDPKKANKMFHRALKDPGIKEFKQQHAGSLVRLAQLRMLGLGCNKSFVSALKHYKAAEEIHPREENKKAIKMLDLLVITSGVELQREADRRNRRLIIAGRSVQYQSLGDWVLLYKHFGFDLSVQPSTEEAKVSLTEDGMVEWMGRAGALQTLPEDYPALSEPMPAQECESPGCDVTEDTSGEKMKKCTECQAPYCGVACQRKDWPRHRPVCEAVQGGIEDDITSHEIELLKQDKGLPQKLSRMGISMEEFERDCSDVKECNHSDSSIPCGLECFQEKGAGSQKKHGYTLVGQSPFTERQRQAAKDLGYDLPQDLTQTDPRKILDKNRNLAAEVANNQVSGKNESKALKRQLAMLKKDPNLTYCLFTPDNENADRGIYLTNGMGMIFYRVLWNRLVQVPWGTAAGSNCLWLAYDMLQNSVEGTKYKNMLRNQLKAEFGADPIECKDKAKVGSGRSTN